MRLVLTPEIFEQGAVEPSELSQLLLLCRRPSAHFVAFTRRWMKQREDPVSRWLRQWPDPVRLQLDVVLSDATESARRPRAISVIVQTHGSRWRPEPGRGPRLSVSDALEMLRTPLHVLVENRRNDGRFVARMAVVLPEDQRSLFDRAIRLGWCVFEQGGGLPEIRKMLEDVVLEGDDAVLCPPAERREIRRWRLAVVVDRDALEPERPSSIPKSSWKAPPRDASRASAESSEVVLRGRATLHEWEGREATHQLHRRAIENYLPARSLRAWVDLVGDASTRRFRRGAVEALLTLDSPNPQGVRPRCYFNMKEGLRGDGPPGLQGDATADAHIHPFFRGLNAAQRSALQAGFNTRKEKIADLFHDRDVVSDEWLREELTRSGDQEAIALLNNLLNRL